MYHGDLYRLGRRVQRVDQALSYSRPLPPPAPPLARANSVAAGAATATATAVAVAAAAATTAAAATCVPSSAVWVFVPMGAAMVPMLWLPDHALELRPAPLCLTHQ